MRRFFQVIKHIHMKNKILVPLVAGYLLFLTAVMMTDSTNAYFISETKVEGQMTMDSTFAEEAEEESDSSDEKDEQVKRNDLDEAS